MKRIVLSDSNKLNSKGYRIDLAGLNLERFATNPVMLYQHDMDKVIGRWSDLKVEGDKLTAMPVFDEGDALGAEVKRKYEGDFLRAASLGLQIKEMREVDGVLTATKGELLEASIVSIPADAGAVVLYNDKREILSFDELRAKLTHTNININKEKMKINLSEQTVESLALPSDYTLRDIEVAVADKDKTIATLNARVSEILQAQITDYLNGAEKDGKITAVEKAEFLKLSATGGFESVKVLIDARPGAKKSSLADMVSQSELTSGRETWTFTDWTKKDSRGLLQLKHENPAMFERLKQNLKHN